MSRRNSIYSRIKTLEQLKEEKRSLDWHIKGVERNLAQEASGRAAMLSGKNLLSLCSSLTSRSSWLATAIPVAVTAFILIRRIREKR